MVRRTVLLLGCLVATLGCHLRTGALLADPARQAAEEARRARVRRVATPLLDGVARPVRLSVSSRAGLRAWSWPDGRIAVTRDLVDAVDDAALAAAVAHELGHLHEASSRSTSGAAIDGGTTADQARERRADALGCSILAAHGVPGGAMLRLLALLEATMPARGAGALAERRVAARTACGPP